MEGDWDKITLSRKRRKVHMYGVGGVQRIETSHMYDAYFRNQYGLDKNSGVITSERPSRCDPSPLRRIMRPPLNSMSSAASNQQTLQ